MPYKNKEKLNAWAKKNYKKNREKILIRQKNPLSKFGRYKRYAKKRNLQFSLSKDEFLILLAQNCHYCGNEKAMGVDRKDNLVGYISFNVVACCKICNYMKWTM